MTVDFLPLGRVALFLEVVTFANDFSQVRSSISRAQGMPAFDGRWARLTPPQLVSLLDQTNRCGSNNLCKPGAPNILFMLEQCGGERSAICFEFWQPNAGNFGAESANSQQSSKTESACLLNPRLNEGVL